MGSQIDNLVVVPTELATKYLETLDFPQGDQALDASFGAQILATIDSIGLKIDLTDGGFSFNSSDLTMDIQEGLEKFENLEFRVESRCEPFDRNTILRVLLNVALQNFIPVMASIIAAIG